MPPKAGTHSSKMARPMTLYRTGPRVEPKWVTTSPTVDCPERIWVVREFQGRRVGLADGISTNPLSHLKPGGWREIHSGELPMSRDALSGNNSAAAPGSRLEHFWVRRAWLAVAHNCLTRTGPALAVLSLILDHKFLARWRGRPVRLRCPVAGRE